MEVDGEDEQDAYELAIQLHRIEHPESEYCELLEAKNLGEA